MKMEIMVMEKKILCIVFLETVFVVDDNNQRKMNVINKFLPL